MDDLISRKALIEKHCAENCGCKRGECGLTYEEDGCEACTFVKEVEEAPAIDAEPVRHGEWVDGDCSVCGYPIPTDDRIDAIFEEEVKYCYHCGTKMDGGKSE